MDLTISLTDNQKAGILNATKQANIQIQVNNLNNGTTDPLLTNKTFLVKFIKEWANQQYEQMYQYRGQQAVQAVKTKMTNEELEALLTQLGVAPLTNLDDWID